MQAPERVSPKNLADYLDVLTRAVFQSGISWRVIEAKWPGTRQALEDFDPERLADLTPDDVDRLVQDHRLVRNRRKIEATIANAETQGPPDVIPRRPIRVISVRAGLGARNGDFGAPAARIDRAQPGQWPANPGRRPTRRLPAHASATACSADGSTIRMLRRPSSTSPRSWNWSSVSVTVSR